ncbi:hypothetical protein, partial [Lactococcus lactis]|uniref:hypothetical protein n=1 Tax=Lactococcus lactis TaxID=1358 RepID=UPI001D195ABE
SESPNRNSVGNQGNKNFEEELKKAVERRQQARNEQGLKDKIFESPNRNSVGNQGNKNFEEELKKAVERRQQARNEQGLKDK